VRYGRAGGQELEAMHARFERHVYHPHSHDAYSIGVTETGAQSFSCRGGRHTSATGMVMAFNPDDPHDGQATDEHGFVYRIVHIGPSLVRDVQVEDLGRAPHAPLFTTPVVADEVLATAARRLHAAILAGAPRLARDERLAAVVAAMQRQASRHAPAAAGAAAARSVASRVRDHLRSAPMADLGAEDLARACGHSRFAVYRAFRAVYGMSPSDYQRQLRLRAARDLLAAGVPPSRAATDAGFADQAHLSRWFVRSFGLTPGAFARAGASHVEG